MKDLLNCTPAFQTRVSRLETGSTRKMSLSFRFVAASRKKSLHISAKSHNAKVKLWIFISLLKHSQVLQVAKYLPIFNFPSFYNKLHLVYAVFARTQTRFGIGRTVCFSFINRNVSTKQILLTWFITFPFIQQIKRSI